MANKTSETVPRLGFWQLLWGVVARPRKTLSLLHAPSRAWLLMALLSLALILLPQLVAPSTVSGDVIPDGLPNPSRPIIIEQEMDAPYMDAPYMDAPTASGPSVLALIGSIVGTLVVWLLWGLALYVASVFLGRSSTFGEMFRLTVWCSVPQAVRGLTQAAYTLITRAPIVNAGLSGFVLDKNAPPVLPPGPGQLALASILAQVDIYLVWQLLLLILGLTAFTNLPRKKSVLAVLVIWGVLALLGVIPAIIGGMFSRAGGF